MGTQDATYQFKWVPNTRVLHSDVQTRRYIKYDMEIKTILRYILCLLFCGNKWKVMPFSVYSVVR